MSEKRTKKRQNHNDENQIIFGKQKALTMMMTQTINDECSFVDVLSIC
jgi:hypothetical protein